MENSLLSKASTATLDTGKKAGVMVLTGVAMTAGAVIFALALKKFAPKTWEQLRGQ